MVSVAEFVWSRLSFLIQEKNPVLFPFVSGVFFVRREENQDERLLAHGLTALLPDRLR